jgi:predicted  nucleic acid-binding Zn-ribbon protein
MPGPAAILREVHRLRSHIHELDTRTEQAPRSLKTQQLRLANQEETLKKAQDALKHVKMKIHEKEVSIKASQQQVDKYERQLKEQITSKKEYDALTAEIKSARATIGKLEDETLAALTESEEQAAKLPAVEAAAKKARADFVQFEKDHQEKLQRYADEKKKALDELKTVEESIPEEVRVDYNRLIKSKGADAFAGVANRICAACYTEVTPQMTNDLVQGAFVVCKNCGRMLYLDN